MKTSLEILKKKFIPAVCSEEYFEYCLEGKGVFLSSVIQSLQAMEEYAEQWQYDFSKKCKCENKIGETLCCNICGLPVVKK